MCTGTSYSTMIALISLQQHNKCRCPTRVAARATTSLSPVGSQDNCNGKLVLPQLNSLHEAFKSLEN